jgi:hypothetical protein
MPRLRLATATLLPVWCTRHGMSREDKVTSSGTHQTGATFKMKKTANRGTFLWSGSSCTPLQAVQIAMKGLN